MATDVYEYPFGSIACFRVEGRFVYSATGLGSQPVYEVKGPFWYAYPPELAAAPECQVRGNFIYEYPLGGSPKYFIK